MEAWKVKLFVEFCICCIKYLPLSLDFIGLICFYKECLLLAMYVGNTSNKAQSQILFELGSLFEEVDRFTEALSFYEEANQIAVKMGDKNSVANTLISSGRVQFALTNSNQAKVCLTTALKTAREVSDKNGETYCILGSVCLLLGDFEKALEYNKKSLDIAIGTADKITERNAYMGLGKASFFLRKHNEAIEYTEKSLAISIKLGDKISERKSYELLGDLNSTLGKYQYVIDYKKKYLNISKEIGHKNGEVESYGYLGNIYYVMNKYQDAIYYYEKSLNYGIENGEKKVEAVSYLNIANSYFSLYKHQMAIKYYKKAIAIAIEIGDTDTQTESYANIGVIFLSLGKYHLAIEYHTKALTNAIATKNRRSEGRIYTNLGNAHVSLSNYGEAIQYYQKSINISEQTGNNQVVGGAYANLGSVYLLSSEYKKAIHYYKMSLDIFKDTGAKKEKATTYMNLGAICNAMGKYQEAIEYHDKSLEIAVQIGDKAREGGTYNNMGNTYLKLSKYLKAIEYLEMSLRLSKEINDKSGMGKTCMNLGNLYLSLRKYQRATEYLEMGLNISKEIGDKMGEGKSSTSLGNVYFSLGQHKKARECYEKSLNIAREIGDKSGEGNAYGNLGNVYVVSSKCQEAIEYYKKSLHIAIIIGCKSSMGKQYVGMGNICTLMGKYDEAIEHHENSLRVAKEIGDKYTEAQANFGFGECYYTKSKSVRPHDEEDLQHLYKLSIHNLKESLRSWDWVFEHLQDQDEYKVSIFDSFIHTYEKLTTVLIETQQIEEALMVSDRGRARALGDLMALKYDIPNENAANTKSLTYSQVQKVVSNDLCILFYAVGEKDLLIWIMSNQKPLVFIKKELKSVMKQLPCNADQSVITRQTFNELIYGSLDKMQLRHVVKCENRSLDTMENAQFQNVPIADDCQQTIFLGQREQDKATSATGDPERQSSSQHNLNPLEMLFSQLLGPVLDNFEQEEIVIIPDGPLYTVPFAALRNPTTGKYLSETKSIRISPSLTTLKALHECTVDHHSKTGALIVGDPNVGEVLFDGEKKQFHSLPSAKREADVIAAILNTKSLTGSQATKEMVKKKLREGVAVIHIAAHGDSEHGNIALAPPPRTDATSIPEEQDYMLTMQEVQEIGVTAQLVVLSCCHSGRGDIKAEGVVGMSRAFLAAGARAVVASLWAIDDEATLSFMVSFYTFLKMGDSASKSLQKAMDDIRGEEGYENPKYWAPFFLFGDDVIISV